MKNDANLNLGFSLAKASEVSTLSESHLRGEIRAGRLRARRAGSRVLITRPDLQEFLDGLPQWTSGVAPAAANAARRKTK